MFRDGTELENIRNTGDQVDEQHTPRASSGEHPMVAQAQLTYTSACKVSNSSLTHAIPVAHLWDIA